MTLKIECKNMCQTFKIFKKMFFFTFLTFFDIFSTLLSTQTIKVIKIIFFNELALRIWAMHMHFNPIPILLCLFLGGGGCGMHPPQSLHRFRPPSLYRVIWELSGWSCDAQIFKNQLFLLNLFSLGFFFWINLDLWNLT